MAGEAPGKIDMEGLLEMLLQDAKTRTWVHLLPDDTDFAGDQDAKKKDIKKIFELLMSYLRLQATKRRRKPAYPVL